MIGSLQALVIDADDIEALAAFYAELLGMSRVEDPDPDWIELADAADRRIAFQKVEGYRAPEWPGQLVPQQMHLDVHVDDLDAGEAAALALGATDAGHRGETFRVYLDPAGHPFCLCA